MLKLKYLAILFLLFISCDSPEVKQKTETLKNVTFTVRSINPNDEDYSDLQFLKKIIERDSIKVMMLGEASHGDGSTFLAKSRLVKFLHKECDFDVLAWESGLFDCTSGWERIKQSGKYYDEIRRAVFSLWVGTKQCEDLLDYLQNTLATTRALELGGFESQITGQSYNTCILLYDELKKISLDFLTQKEKNDFVKIICCEPEIMKGLNKTYYTSILDKISGKYDSLSAIDEKYQYWKLVIDGAKVTYLRLIELNEKGTLKTYREALDSQSISLRDMQMGKNLVWLLNNTYKNRKVIVWAASFHNSRNISELSPCDDSLGYIREVYKKTTTMGDIVYKALGNKMYSIFFTSYSGSLRKLRLEDNDEISKPSDESIEKLFKKMGNKYSYLDIRNPQNPEWLKQEFISRPLGYIEMNGKWSNITDGIFYIEEMEPSSFH